MFNRTWIAIGLITLGVHLRRLLGRRQTIPGNLRDDRGCDGTRSRSLGGIPRVHQQRSVCPTLSNIAPFPPVNPGLDSVSNPSRC